MCCDTFLDSRSIKLMWLTVNELSKCSIIHCKQGEQTRVNKYQKSFSGLLNQINFGLCQMLIEHSGVTRFKSLRQCHLAFRWNKRRMTLFLNRKLIKRNKIVLELNLYKGSHIEVWYWFPDNRSPVTTFSLGWNKTVTAIFGLSKLQTTYFVWRIQLT